MELRGVGEGNPIGLLGHGAADFRNTVADADDGGLAGSVEVAAAIGVDDPAAFAEHGDGIIFAKIAGKKRRGAAGSAHSKIVAEGAKHGAEARNGGESQVGRERRVGGILFRGFGGLILSMKSYARIAVVLAMASVFWLRGAEAQNE